MCKAYFCSKWYLLYIFLGFQAIDIDLWSLAEIQFFLSLQFYDDALKICGLITFKINVRVVEYIDFIMLLKTWYQASQW